MKQLGQQIHFDITENNIHFVLSIDHKIVKFVKLALVALVRIKFFKKTTDFSLHVQLRTREGRVDKRKWRIKFRDKPTRIVSSYNVRRWVSRRFPETIIWSINSRGCWFGEDPLSGALTSTRTHLSFERAVQVCRWSRCRGVTHLSLHKIQNLFRSIHRPVARIYLRKWLVRQATKVVAVYVSHWRRISFKISLRLRFYSFLPANFSSMISLDLATKNLARRIHGIQC